MQKQKQIEEKLQRLYDNDKPYNDYLDSTESHNIFGFFVEILNSLGYVVRMIRNEKYKNNFEIKLVKVRKK